MVFSFDAREVLNGTESKDTKIAKNNLLNKAIETQITKAEPSQKQKVATVDVTFCGGNSNFASNEPTVISGEYKPYCLNLYTSKARDLSYEHWKNRRGDNYKPENFCVNKDLTAIFYQQNTNCQERADAFNTHYYNIKFLL